MAYNLIQQDIDDFETMKIEFKENGKEKEAIDNLYKCLNCMYIYEYCECDKGIKELINKEKDLQLSIAFYKYALNCKPSKYRNEVIKKLSDKIKQF